MPAIAVWLPIRWPAGRILLRREVPSPIPIDEDETLLVGAAGFEPATWSTQNSRATRLRYTPPGSMGEKHPCGRRQEGTLASIHTSPDSGNV
jgi:hypothetical protein